MNKPFTYTFFTVILITIALFVLGELFIDHRNTLAKIAAIFEGIVFIMLAYVLYKVKWHGLPSWVFALLPLIGSLLAFNMAYKRLMGLPL